MPEPQSSNVNHLSQNRQNWPRGEGLEPRLGGQEGPDGPRSSQVPSFRSTFPEQFWSSYHVLGTPVA